MSPKCNIPSCKEEATNFINTEGQPQKTRCDTHYHAQMGAASSVVKAVKKEEGKEAAAKKAAELKKANEEATAFDKKKQKEHDAKEAEKRSNRPRR